MIALVTIPHVMVAHFAIGGGLFLAIYGARARSTNDPAMLSFVRSHSRFFMLLTLVFGALTGVGIWFTIGLVSPAATSALIHTFVWFWATEWVMFFVEIAAAIVYYYGWDRLDATTHQRVIWLYFGAAWGSLAVINGIITFMLTSGTWVTDHNIWPAFFNVTYFPSLIFRTLLCLVMAGIFAILTAAFQNDDSLRSRINRIAILWTIPSIGLLVPTGYWYFSALPQSTKLIVSGGWTALKSAQHNLFTSAIGLSILVVLTMLTKNRNLNRVLSGFIILIGLNLFGSFEWYREAARKPYVISNYMYSNGMLVNDTTSIKEAGLFSSMLWKHSDQTMKGEDLFRAACQSCHSLSGYNGIAKMVAERGWTEEQLGQLVQRTGYFRGAMPPFVGTVEEANLIATYIATKANSLNATPESLTPKRIWDNNCGLCHTLDGSRPLRATLSGLSVADLQETILTVDQLSDAIPKFFGSDVDADKLASYLEAQISKREEGVSK